MCRRFHMCWSNSYTDEGTARAVMSAEMRRDHEGYLRIQMRDLEQTIILIPHARRFGGHQWYFMCPAEDRCCSVLWGPPGASLFRCKQAWGKRVAYTSQFLNRDNRAHRGQAKIKSRLQADGALELWELHPKPKVCDGRPTTVTQKSSPSTRRISNMGLTNLALGSPKNNLVPLAKGFRFLPAPVPLPRLALESFPQCGDGIRSLRVFSTETGCPTK